MTAQQLDVTATRLNRLSAQLSRDSHRMSKLLKDAPAEKKAELKKTIDELSQRLDELKKQLDDK